MPDDCAYVALTSGTTGRPHAVLGAEEPVLRFLRWYADTFELTGQDRFSVLAGLGHDPLLRELLLPLTLGAVACLPPPDVRPVPTRLLDWLRAERVTVLHLTPAVARLLAAAGTQSGTVLPAARHVGLGGAPVTRADLTALRALCPAARIVSLYGTTETPQGVGVVDLAEEFAPGRPYCAPPIGTGGPGAGLVVLDDRLRTAAVDEIGQIAVRGSQLALGYLGEPELTAARFRPDPWAEGRLFLTGDRGRRRPDGGLEFLGRADSRLSINGQRVEAADIEDAARACPGVRECVLAAPEADTHGTDQGGPVLYVSAGPGVPPGLRDRVAAHLAEVLPATLQPAAIRLVPAVPLTVNGKVDHAELARLARAGAPETAPPPDDDREALVGRILSLWKTVLGQDVSPDQNFFDAGGTSVELLALHALVEAEFGRPVELLSLFRYPTAGRLATALAAGPPSGPPPPESLPPEAAPPESPRPESQSSELSQAPGSPATERERRLEARLALRRLAREPG